MENDKKKERRKNVLSLIDQFIGDLTGITLFIYIVTIMAYGLVFRSFMTGEASEISKFSLNDLEWVRLTITILFIFIWGFSLLFWIGFKNIEPYKKISKCVSWAIISIVAMLISNKYIYTVSTDNVFFMVMIWAILYLAFLIRRQSFRNKQDYITNWLYFLEGDAKNKDKSEQELNEVLPAYIDMKDKQRIVTEYRKSIPLGKAILASATPNEQEGAANV